MESKHDFSTRSQSARYATLYPLFSRVFDYIRDTETVREALKRLFTFLVKEDLRTAQNTRKSIAESLKLLQQFPFTGCKTRPVLFTFYYTTRRIGLL